MIKTVSVNLGGVVFQIDEDAYEALKNYLNSLNQYYKYTEGRDEIVSDIEARLSELFNEIFDKTGSNVISMADVTHVVEIMGKPEDFDDDGERMEGTSSTKSQNSNSWGSGFGQSANKRLYRDPSDAIIAGVSSGLSTYFGINDPIWMRIVFILFTIGTFGTVGPVVYIILWAILQPAETSAQKLQMKGEPINVSNLEKKMREELGKAGENLKDFASNHNTRGTLGKIVNFIGKLFGAVARFALGFFKLIFYIILIGIGISMFVTLISVIISFIILLPAAFKYIFSGTLFWILGGIGGLLVFGIPLMLLIYLPFRIWGKKRTTNRAFLPITGVLFIIGLISLGIASSKVASYFSSTEIESKEQIIATPSSGKLHLSINEEENAYKGLEYNLRFSNLFSFTKELETASDLIELDILPSKDGNIYFEQVYRACGNSDQNAAENAKAITHQVKITEDQIVFDQYFGLGKNKQWRNQVVKLKLYVPDSLTLSFSKDMGIILDNVDNKVKASKYTVAGNRWLMKDGILEPIDSVLTMGSQWSKQSMENFDFKNFNKVKFKGNMHAEIIQGSGYEVYMSANKRISKDIVVEKDGDELIITSNIKNWGMSLGWINPGNNSADFYIVVPDLQLVTIGKQADVLMTDFVQDNITIYCGGQSNLDFENVNIKSMEIEMHGQSSLNVVGKAEKIALDGSGQSTFNGEEFETAQVIIDLSGQSNADIKVKESIEGSLSGQSAMGYYGNPTIDVQTEGQSEIEKY